MDQVPCKHETDKRGDANKPRNALARCTFERMEGGELNGGRPITGRRSNEVVSFAVKLDNTIVGGSHSCKFLARGGLCRCEACR